MSKEPGDAERDDEEDRRQPADRQPPGEKQDSSPEDRQPQGGRSQNQPRQGGEPRDRQPQAGGNQPGAGQPQGRQPQAGGNQPGAGQPQAGGNQPGAGQPQGGQPQAGGSQPGAGQPQAGGNQPGAGQPQGGQPRARGSQPGGGQPQGGQPRVGQPQGQQFQTGLDVDTNYLQEWAVYVTALFGVGGVGLGVLWILIDAIDEPIFEPEGTSSLGGAIESSTSAIAATPVLITMLMILAVAAVFLGAWFGRKLGEPDRESFVIAGGSVAAGAAVFFLLVSVLLSVGLDGLSANIGGIIINLILTVIFIGAIAAGGAAVTRNLAPRDL